MLKPILDVHSIEAISLTCQYDGEVNSVGLSVIKEEASRLKLKYQSRRVARRGGNHGDSFSSEASDIFGYSFVRKDSGRELGKFELVNDRAVVVSYAYTGFKDFLADVSLGLELAHKAFLRSERKLEKIVLTYKNSLVSNDHQEIDGAVRDRSPYIAAACLEKGNFWHSRIGFFSNDHLTYPLTLHNIEASHKLLLKEDGEQDDDAPNVHQLQVDIHHVRSVGEPVDAEGFLGFLEAQAYELRDKHRDILCGIFTDEVLGLIGLSKER